VEFTAWSQGLTVEVGGADVVSHVGTAVLRMLGDKVGLTGGLSAAMAGTRQLPLHDRGRVLTDLAAAVADGGTRIKDIAVLGDQATLFKAVASVPTVWRALEEADATRLAALAVAWARVRVPCQHQTKTHPTAPTASKETTRSVEPAPTRYDNRALRHIHTPKRTPKPSLLKSKRSSVNT
jgi:Transposase DDE domain group 1